MRILAAINKLEKMADSTLLRLEGDYDIDLERNRLKVIQRYKKRLPLIITPFGALIETPLIKEPLSVASIIYKIKRLSEKLYPESR